MVTTEKITLKQTKAAETLVARVLAAVKAAKKPVVQRNSMYTQTDELQQVSTTHIDDPPVTGLSGIHMATLLHDTVTALL